MRKPELPKNWEKMVNDLIAAKKKKKEKNRENIFSPFWKKYASAVFINCKIKSGQSM